MTVIAHGHRPPAWDVLQQAVIDRRPVAARYHGHDRVICPHALGWKNGRLVALVYQSEGSTSSGKLPTDTGQRWRSMALDDIENPTLIGQGSWKSAANYSAESLPMDQVLLTILEP
jgi:hypothetical protein